MQHHLRWHLIAIALVLVVCACTVPAYADPQYVSGCAGCNGYTFSATLTPTGSGNYSLSYTITNVSGSPALAYNWSLTLFDNSSSITGSSNFSVSDGNTAAYQVATGKSNNGNASCSSSVSNAICVEPSGIGTLSTIGVGQSLTFTFDINCSGDCTELANWIFLASGDCVSNTNANCYAISTTGQVPEPSTLALLLGSGLVGLPFIRHKWRF